MFFFVLLFWCGNISCKSRLCFGLDVLFFKVSQMHPVTAEKKKDALLKIALLTTNKLVKHSKIFTQKYLLKLFKLKNSISFGFSAQATQRIPKTYNRKHLEGAMKSRKMHHAANFNAAKTNSTLFSFNITIFWGGGKLQTQVDLSAFVQSLFRSFYTDNNLFFIFVIYLLFQEFRGKCNLENNLLQVRNS